MGTPTSVYVVVAPSTRWARPNVVITARSFWSTVKKPKMRWRITNQIPKPMSRPGTTEPGSRRSRSSIIRASYPFAPRSLGHDEGEAELGREPLPGGAAPDEDRPAEVEPVRARQHDPEAGEGKAAPAHRWPRRVRAVAHVDGAAEELGQPGHARGHAFRRARPGRDLGLPRHAGDQQPGLAPAAHRLESARHQLD